MLSVILVIVALWSVFGSVTKTDLKYYEQLTNEVTILPKLSELKNSETINFKYYYKNNLIFGSDAYTLSVKYDEDTYFNEKKELETKYTFHLSDMYNKSSIFYMDSFRFQALSLENDEISYPKRLMFIGTSDKLNEIVYVFYRNDDLDYIEFSFDYFFKKECGWK